MTDMLERAARAIFVADGHTAPDLLIPEQVTEKARAALLAALDPEDEALVMAMADAIEDSTGGASGSYSAAQAAIAALKAHCAQGERNAD